MERAIAVRSEIRKICGNVDEETFPQTFHSVHCVKEL